MSALAICINVALAFFVGGMAGWELRARWKFNGPTLAEQRGRDLQRVDDILELWRAMPDRDSRGRFKHKEKSP